MKRPRNLTLIAGIPSKNNFKSANILVIESRHTVLIQTDKAVYKAGDKVQFRVLAINADTKPYRFNKMTVAVTDANRNAVYKLTPNYGNGVYEGSLKLSEEALIGNWGIQVKIDNHAITTKNFEVRDYQTPRFLVVFATDAVITLNDNFIKATIFGQYTIGSQLGLVKGTALVKVEVFKLNMKNPPFHQFEKSLQIKGREILEFDLEKDLKITSGNRTFVKFTLTVEEDLTKKNRSIEKIVMVDGRNEQTFEIIKKEKFKPGLPYHISVLIKDRRDESISKSFKKIRLHVQYYKHPSKCSSDLQKDSFTVGQRDQFESVVESGIAEFTVETENDHNAIKFTLFYGSPLEDFIVFREPSRSREYIEAKVVNKK